MKKIALITGISGQDGAFLADFLIKNKYIVVGTDRRSSRDDKWRLENLGIIDKIIIEDLDINETSQIYRILNKYKFDEIYNLAAQSFVASSFLNPLTTANTTAIACLKILETIRNLHKKPKFYQASSSEMYGGMNIFNKKQNEDTPFNPRSPYAISKLFAHYITKNYRESYKLFAVSGICFNHESHLRGEEFVTRKITSCLAKIQNKKLKYFELGNIYAKRDWGYAGDYVVGMWKSLQMVKADDYVFATGETHTIKQFIDEARKFLSFETYWIGKNLNMELRRKDDKKAIIKINKNYFRPTEVNVLVGDSTKAKKILGWKPKCNFKNLVKKMMQEDLRRFS